MKLLVLLAAVAVTASACLVTLPPGAGLPGHDGIPLPSGEWCADHVVPTPEDRPENAVANATPGSGAPNARWPRVDGRFTGTTDEIIQWAACKWGIQVDWARAQVAKESWWLQDAGGDLTADQSACHPTLRTTDGSPCPESVGMMQVRYSYHTEAFQDGNAIRSTAYNLDYAFAHWRSCFDGELTWLNTVERGAQYAAGDLLGCMGVWFSGRWYVDQAFPYMDAVASYRDQRVWDQPWF